MNLTETWLDLRNVLEPLGVEVGREVLDIWKDRQQHGSQPLPDTALRDLVKVATKLLEETTFSAITKA